MILFFTLNFRYHVVTSAPTYFSLICFLIWNVIKCIKCISFLTDHFSYREQKAYFLEICFYSGILTFILQSLVGILFHGMHSSSLFISCSCVKNSNTNMKEWNRLPYNIYTIWFYSLIPPLVWKLLYVVIVNWPSNYYPLCMTM